MAGKTASNELWSKMPVYWEEALKPLVPEDKFENLATHVLDAYKHENVSPNEEYLFRAFELVEPSEVKAVILGHDPYNNPSLAQGLSFAIPETASISGVRSLRAVRDELYSEYPNRMRLFDQTLSSWASQGVLLLNTLLTVEADGKAGSHRAFGWLHFTDAVLRCLDERGKVVFLLWGGKARDQARMRNLANALQEHHVIEAHHPSSFKRDKLFLGCNCFREANKRLGQMGVDQIEWLG